MLLLLWYLFSIICRVINTNGKLSARKRFSIRQKSLTIHSSFCPIISQRQGFCVISASEDMCGKPVIEKISSLLLKTCSSLSL
jgi:hypothetical protein